MRVLLLSTYELGHQPLGLARPAADLMAAGHEVRCLDLAVDPLDDSLVQCAELVGISVPMHTATRLGARVAERIRTVNPGAHVTFYGLYASLHADVLIGKLGDSAIGGEYEGPLVALANGLSQTRSTDSAHNDAPSQTQFPGSAHNDALRQPQSIESALATAPSQMQSTDGALTLLPQANSGLLDILVQGGTPATHPPAGSQLLAEGEGESIRILPTLAVIEEGAGQPDSPASGRGGRGVTGIPGVRTATHDGGVFLGRQAFRLPRRDLLPPLDRYAQVDLGTHQKLAGYVEASRGCAHRCLHCPITPVYGGRLRIVERDVVLEDIEQLVGLGAEHITFGDPDFFNGIRHSLRIVEALHEAFPAVSYDVTIKVEHLLEHRQHLATLARTGCLFIVSAVEAVHDHILTHLDKGHSAADIDTALGLAAEVGIPLRPTFVPFTPWISLVEYLDLLAFVRSRGLIGHIDPVQYAIRLLVPRGSSLYGTPSLTPYAGAFDPETFSYGWTHPDPRMDALQREIARLVERAACSDEPPVQTFVAIERLVLAAAGQHTAPGGGTPGGLDDIPGLPTAAFVPRLTETWFC